MSKFRDTSEITLGGKTFKLKATVEALMNIEDRSGRDLLTILTTISAIKIPFKIVSIIFYEFQLAAGGELKFLECAEALRANGYARLSPPLLELLAASVMAGKEEASTQEKTDPN